MTADDALGRAATAWREGRLLEAQSTYQELLKAQPTAWPAAFQLAWLDAAVGELAPARARALDRAGLSAEAHRRAQALIAQAESGAYADGSIADWDIGALDAAGEDQDEDWWLDRGKRAWKVGLFGVAHACYERAARRWNVLYDDPPSWAQGALTQADDHVRAVMDPDA